MGSVLLAAVSLALFVAVLCVVLAPLPGPVGGWLGGGVARRRASREAEERAEALLRTLLTPAEHAALVARGYLEVRSPGHPGRVYRVPRDGGIVVYYDAGRAAGGLCVQAVEPIPAADAVAMHKLMIEGAEADYLQRANHLTMYALTRYGLSAIYDW